MEPNESHHHHLHHHQDQQHLSSPYFHLFHHNPTTTPPPATSSAGNNGDLLSSTNDGSSSLFSVPSSAVTVPIDPVKRKRGRPRKYETPAQALAAKKLASSASNSSARERREQAATAAAAGNTTSSFSKSASIKSILGSVGKTGQSFTPHIVNITPGEDVAQKIILYAQQSKHELCILSASGSISNASLSHLTSGTSASYEGKYEILSLSGSYIRSEHGGKTGGLSVCLSSSDGQIFGGGVGGLLKAAGPVQVILGTFQLEKKIDGRNGVKGNDTSGSGNTLLPSSLGTESLLGFHSGMETSGRNPNDEHHTVTSSALGGGTHFMMQPPQGMHMTHARTSEWGGAGYDFSGIGGNGSSENGNYE